MLTYKDFSGEIKFAQTYWEIQAAQLQNPIQEYWVIEFDPSLGEWYA